MRRTWHGALLATATCAALLTAHADPAAHRQLASEILDLVNTPAALRAGIKAAVLPTLATLRNTGAPEAALAEISATMEDWAEHDLVWDEIKPRLIDLYVHEFSESELRDLLAFYRTPVGAKALKRFPSIFAEGSRIGQQYAESKQPLLEQRLERIADKYNAGRKSPSSSRQ